MINNDLVLKISNSIFNDSSFHESHDVYIVSILALYACM